jgi:hypothetical protein
MLFTKVVHDEHVGMDDIAHNQPEAASSNLKSLQQMFDTAPSLRLLVLNRP